MNGNVRIPIMNATEKILSFLNNMQECNRNNNYFQEQFRDKERSWKGEQEGGVLRK